MKVRHAQVETWMVEMVRRRLTAFDYRGKLDRQHYSFVKTGVVAPFPIYHHLVFCYNRTGRRLQARVACSLLPKWQLKRSLGRISHLSQMLSCDLSGHTRFLKSREFFEGNLHHLLTNFLAEKTDLLAEDDYLREALLKLQQDGKLSEKDYPAKLRSDLRLVQKQHTVEDVTEVEDEASDELHAFLSELVPAKAEVSAGSFTLNAKHASRKLQQFQLSSPQNFVVHLVGGAIAGGATKVDVYVDTDDIVVSFDGKPMTRGEISDLEESLLHAEGSSRARELNVALNAAKSLDPRWLHLETWHDDSGWQLNFGRGESPVALKSRPFEGEGHRVHFRDKPSLDLVAKFLASLSHGHRELNVIQQRCRMADVPVIFKGKDLRVVPWDEAALAVIVEDPSQPLGLTPPEELPCHRVPTEAGYSALFLIGPEPELAVRVNGILYEPPRREVPTLCWCLLIDNTLERDLSFSGVRNNERLMNLWRELDTQETEFEDYILKQLPSLEKAKQFQVTHYLRERLREGRHDLSDERVFSTLDGERLALSSLTVQNQFFVTTKNWEYGLRSQEQVLLMSRAQQDFLKPRLGSKCPRLVKADKPLRESQQYFERRKRWLALSPLKAIKVESPYGVTRALKRLNGEISLQRSPGASQLLPYTSGRPLASSQLYDFPKGLIIAVDFEGLEPVNDWSGLLPNKAYQDMMSDLRSEIDSYYSKLLLEDGRYNVHYLHYLLYRKRHGKGWERQLGRMSFRMRDGSTRTWEELNEADSFKESFRSQWLTIFHLSSGQKRLLSELQGT